ncbi:hypothetical protein [Deinococcus sp. UR1]|uniref:hypothetical protein n=1 Tax=Deinococcus sp. UR1 TaxID=1704277 RepID=UPI000C190971|nr:hypothetical protein [Deinococcus sp. UR1]PIG96885.1 hypothetical protein AMD26_015265 [Deinococcus sp. UR1]
MNELQNWFNRLKPPAMNLRSILPTPRAVVLMQPDSDGKLQLAPPAGVVGGAASEATLQQVRDAISILNGNTDGVEALLQAQKNALDALGLYNDGVEGLLGTLNANTDGIEGLLNALGLKDDNVLAKLEALRVLLAGTLTVNTGNADPATGARQSTGNTTLASILTALTGQATKTEAQPISATALPLPTGAATQATLASVLAALQGTLLVRGNPDIPAIVTLNFAAGSSASDPILLNTQAVAAIDLGPNWTAADLSVEHSTDGGATWYPMYDTFGNLIQYKIAANRSVVVPLADLMRRGRIRFRSGVPGAYVPQGVITVLTLTLVTV